MKINMNLVWVLITIFCVATWALWFFQIDIRNLNPTPQINSLIYNSNPTVFDCENDWTCFQEKLLFCEKAKVSTQKDSVPYKLRMYVSENGAIIEVEKLEAEYLDYGTAKGYVNRCYTIITNSEGDRFRCKYLTNEPNTDERKQSEPFLFQCNLLR